MLEFKELTLSDMELIRPFFSRGAKICDNTPSTQMMWREIFKTEYAEFNGCLILKQLYFDGSVVFLMPIGENVEASVREINSWCEQNGVPFKICFATKEQAEFLSKIFDISVTEETDWSDYIYNLTDLSDMTGKKYSGQRNHINAFVRENKDFYFKPLTNENSKETKEFFSEYNQNSKKDSALFNAEQKMVYEVLDNLDIYKMTGLCLYVNGKMSGFTAGEIIGDTLYVHIEKANTDIRGAYQILVKEFAKAHHNKAKFINREEDMGDEGLRKSKLSYNPCALVSKYTITKNAI